MDEWTRIAVLGKCNGEIFECASSALLLEYTREDTISRNGRVHPLSLSPSVCENFSHRFIRTSSFVRSLQLGSLLVSGSGRERLSLSHSLTLTRSFSISFFLSHSFSRSKDRKSFRGGLYKHLYTYTCNRLQSPIPSLLFSLSLYSWTNPFCSLLVKCQIERRSSNRTRLIGYTSLFSILRV